VLQTPKGYSSVAVAFSPHGKVLASGSDDETVKLWDAGTGAVLQTLESHSDTVNAIAVSPDGKLLASGSDDETVKLWDVGMRAVLQTLKFGAFVNTLSFSEDGTFLQTNRGGLHATSLSFNDDISQLSLSHNIFVEGQWICWCTEDMLWLPLEYRSYWTAVYGSVVALGIPLVAFQSSKSLYFPRPPSRPPPLQLTSLYT
jgi:WD40 repeat protein